MPPARSDVPLLVFAAIAAVMAGIAVAVVLLLSTGRSEPPREYEPFAAGPAPDLRRELDDGGPFFIPDPFGGDRGFWLALEDGRIVTVAAQQRSLPDCTVRWRATLDRFVCDEERFVSEQLERFETTVPESGDREGVVLVDLRRRFPAPDPPAPASRPA